MKTNVLKRIVSLFSLMNTIIIVSVLPISSVAAHSLTSWANKYPASNAGGSYHFGIGDCFHINGSNAKYYWANGTTKSYFSTSFINGASAWGGLITCNEVTNFSDAHVKIEYNPNKVGNYAAYVTTIGPSIGHYEPGSSPTEMVVGAITGYTSTEKKQVFTHEIGHLWGIEDLYDYNTGLNSIYSDTYAFNAPTRHDTNAMRICLNSLYFNTGNGWKYQKSPGVWAKDEWIAKYGKTNYFDKNGISSYYVNGIVPTTSMNLANGVYEIEGKTSGKLIHTAYATDGSVAHLYTRSVNPVHINNQRFKFTRQSDNTYSIKVLSSNKYLTVPDSNYNSGVQLKFYDWNGSNSQKWYVISRENGYVKFVNKHSCLAIDIRNNTTTNGTAIQQYTYTDVNAQLFKLVKIS